jgi:hypothetical protein
MKRAWQNFATQMDHYKAIPIAIGTIEMSLRILSNTIKIIDRMR